MKNRAKITGKGRYVGAAGGLLLFAVIGLLPSSFIGGVLGLQIANSVFGATAAVAVVPRAMVGIGMLLGVVVTGTVFVSGATLVGWLLGRIGSVAKARLLHRLA